MDGEDMALMVCEGEREGYDMSCDDGGGGGAGACIAPLLSS
jgi:hypothetical protein